MNKKRSLSMCRAFAWTSVNALIVCPRRERKSTLAQRIAWLHVDAPEHKMRQNTALTSQEQYRTLED
jgi:hypothetical protein